MTFLEKIPYPLLILVAVVMAIMPLGQSHLLEKTRMLFSGTLRRPLDWFDFAMHGSPLVVLIVKAHADLAKRGSVN